MPHTLRRIAKSRGYGPGLLKRQKSNICITSRSERHENHRDAGVSVYVDGQLLGSIGPGGSVSASLEAPSCLVRVECGVYSRELILGQDSALQVSWGLNPPEMIVSHTKK